MDQGCCWQPYKIIGRHFVPDGIGSFPCKGILSGQVVGGEEECMKHPFIGISNAGVFFSRVAAKCMKPFEQWIGGYSRNKVYFGERGHALPPTLDF